MFIIEDCLIFDFSHRFEIENSLDVEEVAIAEWGHDTPDGLLLVDEGARHDVHLLLLQVVGGVRHFEQFDQSFLVVHGPHLHNNVTFLKTVP